MKKRIISVTSASKWTEYQRLIGMLSLGMTPPEVERILGRPSIADTLSLGQRWVYFEDESTAGWTCAVEFRREGAGASAVLKLCYIVNIEHIVFRDSSRIEIGERLNVSETEGTVILGLWKRPVLDSATNQIPKK